MINLLKADNITVISSESFDEDPTNQIANLKVKKEKKHEEKEK